MIDKKNELIRRLDEYRDDVFTDMLMLYAHDIEDALITSGAVPGQDYDYVKLMELAHPYVLAHMQEKQLELSAKF